MTIHIKTSLLALSIGAAMQASPAQAVNATHTFRSNAVNHCQAFTPGVENTIRNRVVGAENIGDQSIAVACSFHTLTNGANASVPNALTLFFSNNRSAGPIIFPVTVTCTLLTGHQASGTNYAVTKTTSAIPFNGAGQRSLRFDGSDIPNNPGGTLMDWLLGVNCTLPRGAVINDTYLTWVMDNGVGN